MNRALLESKTLWLFLGLFAVPLDNEYLPARRHRHGPVVTYEVVAEDLDRVEQEATSVGTDVEFATFWLPIGIGCLLTVIAVPMSPKAYNTYFMTMLVSLGFGLYFGFRGWRQRGKLKRLIARIRDSQVGPLGEEGKELRPSELANLPAGQGGPTQLTVEAPEPLEADEGKSPALGEGRP